jgi:hypothetical protein
LANGGQKYLKEKVVTQFGKWRLVYYGKWPLFEQGPVRQ